MLRIAILDDYQDVALSLADWGLLGDEKRRNPFLRVTSLEQFLMFMGA